MSKDELKELEDLARKFIIGYTKLSDEQLKLISQIALVEEKIQEYNNLKRRYEKVLDVLHKKLADSHFTD